MQPPFRKRQHQMARSPRPRRGATTSPIVNGSALSKLRQASPANRQNPAATISAPGPHLGLPAPGHQPAADERQRGDQRQRRERRSSGRARLRARARPSPPPLPHGGCDHDGRERPRPLRRSDRRDRKAHRRSSPSAAADSRSLGMKPRAALRPDKRLEVAPVAARGRARPPEHPPPRRARPRPQIHRHRRAARRAARNPGATR